MMIYKSRLLIRIIENCFIDNSRKIMKIECKKLFYENLLENKYMDEN